MKLHFGIFLDDIIGRIWPMGRVVDRPALDHAFPLGNICGLQSLGPGSYIINIFLCHCKTHFTCGLRSEYPRAVMVDLCASTHIRT